MKIDENLERRIRELRKKYPEYSREDELIIKVSGWIHLAAKSLIPNRDLDVARGYIYLYSGGVAKSRPDNYLIKELQGIVEDAWDIYGEAEVVRN